MHATVSGSVQRACCRRRHERRLIEWRLARQPREERRAAAVEIARLCELGGRVALDRLRRDLLDVGEHRPGQLALCIGRRPAARRRLAHATPRDTRADTVGGLQRVERAPRHQLAVAEVAVDRPGGGLLLAEEAAEGQLDARADSAAEVAAQRARVPGHLALDRDHDLLGEIREGGADRIRGAGSERCSCARGIVLLTKIVVHRPRT